MAAEYRTFLKRAPVAVSLAVFVGLLVGVALVNTYANGTYVDAESLRRLTLWPPVTCSV